MNYKKKSILKIAFFLLSYLICACNNEEFIDIREPYIGSYEFVIIKKSSIINFPGEYDTAHYIGTIQKYKPADSEIDVFFGDDSEKNEREINKLTINFSDKLYLTTEINSDGVFTPRNSYFVSQGGKFINHDSVEFSYAGRSGTMGGHQNTIRGKKIE